MKKNKVIGIIIFLLVILLITLLMLLTTLKKEEENPNIQIPEVVSKPTTVEEVLNKHDIDYTERKRKDLYVNFEKDLFDENGNSNEEYFNSVIEELNPYFEDYYTLIDEEKNIKIRVNIETGTIIINNKENFFKETNGNSYSKVDTIKIVERENMIINDDTLSNMSFKGMYITDAVKEDLGPEDEVQNDEKYISYQNGNIKVSKYEISNRIRNIIYSREYGQDVMYGVGINDSLGTIAEKHPTIAFGSVREGFLGYRTTDVYIFFYNDEISIYGYSYMERSDLEEYLEEYLNTKDLEAFAIKMIAGYDNYYEYAYDAEAKNLYMSYPSLGFIIDIKNNDSTGITFYQNCYMTDKMKQFVKDGLISLNPDVDLIEQAERKRVGK